MEYYFKRQEISGDKVLFVLVLDKKASKERILIGNEIEITKRLWDDTDAGIYYDMTRPLGTLFKGFKRDNEAELIGKGFMPLWNALHSNRWKQLELEEVSSSFCSEMYQTRDPLSISKVVKYVLN